MNKYKILADNNISVTGNESKYQRRYKRRKVLSRQVSLFYKGDRILTVSELIIFGVWR